MAFKMKNQGGAFKMMGSSPLKATAEEMRAAGVSEGTVKLADKARANPKMDNDKWKAGSDAAKKSTGRSLNELVASRKGLEKGSNEYNKIQNSINESLGNKKRYDVKADAVVKGNKATTTDTDPNTGEARTSTATTRKDGSTKKIVTETADKKIVQRDQPMQEGSKTTTKTGRSTEDKSDDVKQVTRVRGGDKQSQTTRTRTADTVSKTRNDLKTGESTSTSRKRLGKGLIKGAVAKGKAKRDARKANKPVKVKGSKAPEGTT